MNRLLVRAPRGLRRRPFPARRAVGHDDPVEAVLDSPAPVGLIVASTVALVVAVALLIIAVVVVR